MSQLARDNHISISTDYEYHDEAITVLAIRRPSLHGELLAAKIAGHTHVILGGTLIPTEDQPAYNAIHSALRCLSAKTTEPHDLHTATHAYAERLMWRA